MKAMYYNRYGRDIEKLIPLYNVEVLQHAGSYGCIYQIPFKNKVVKIFRSIDEEKQIRHALSLKNNKVLKENNVILPEDEVYVDQILMGYTMRLVRGYSIDELQRAKYIPEIPFAEFKRAYLKAIEQIKNIENAGIEMKDLYACNIMYDLEQKCLCFIDIDQWHKTEKVSSCIELFESYIDLDVLKKKMDKNNTHFFYMNRIYYNAKEIRKLLDKEFVFSERFMKNNLVINICKGPKESYFIDQIEGENEKDYLFIKTLDITDNEKSRKKDPVVTEEKQFKLKKMNKALEVASSFDIQLENVSMQENILWNKEHNCFIFLGNIKSFNQVEVPKKNSLSEKIKNCIEKVETKQKIFSKLLR